MIVRRIPDKDIQETTTIFKHLDKDHTGMINLNELHQALEDHNLNINRK